MSILSSVSTTSFSVNPIKNFILIFLFEKKKKKPLPRFQNSTLANMGDQEAKKVLSQWINKDNENFIARP